MSRIQREPAPSRAWKWLPRTLWTRKTSPRARVAGIWQTTRRVLPDVRRAGTWHVLMAGWAAAAPTTPPVQGAVA